MKYPKWVNPERQAYLVKLWSMYGNRCLLGHLTCPKLEHYVHTDTKLVLVAEAKSVKCVDTSGNPIKDSQGNPLYMTVYPIKKDYLHSKRLTRLYDLKSETIIKDWIASDRSQSQANYQAEYQARHKIHARTFPLYGKFSGIAQDIYYDSQPDYYLENLGISGLTFKPFARLRLASNQVRLYVDIDSVFKKLSKNKKRKAIRYGKTTKAIQDSIDNLCYLAVKHYQNS